MKSRPGGAKRSVRGWIAGVAAVSAIVFMTPEARSALQDEDDRRQTTRAGLEKWVDVKRRIEKERNDWAVNRELLADRAEVLELQIEAERQKTAEAVTSIEAADVELATNESLINELGLGLGALEESIVDLEDRVRNLVPRLPLPLKGNVDLLIQRLPVDSNKTEMKLADRFLTVIGILNAANKFNREIFQTPERRELSDGRIAEVTTMYIGLGKAYFASSDGKFAGIGTPTDEGWVFEHADGSAAQIARSIRVLTKEDNPAFVRIPMKVD